MVVAQVLALVVHGLLRSRSKLRSRWDALRTTTTTAAARVVCEYHPEKRIVIVIVRTAHPLRHRPPRLRRRRDDYPTVDSVSDGAVPTRRIHCVSDAGGSLVVIFVVVVRSLLHSAVAFRCYIPRLRSVVCCSCGPPKSVIRSASVRPIDPNPPIVYSYPFPARERE
jgi:hypothetical protein